MTIERTLAASLKKEVARIKGADEYTWGTYNGPAMEIKSRRGTSITMTRGTRFGSRLSSNGREIRFVFPEWDPNLSKVFTIDPDVARVVYKRSTMQKETQLNLRAMWNELNASCVRVVSLVQRHMGKGLWTLESLDSLERSVDAAAPDLYKAIKSQKDFEARQANVEKVTSAALALKVYRPKQSDLRLMKKHVTGLVKVATFADNYWTDEPSLFLLNDVIKWHKLATAFAMNDLNMITKYSWGDTAWRDEIPSETWDWIQDNAR